VLIDGNAGVLPMIWYWKLGAPPSMAALTVKLLLLHW
jgi:hypothetical protein